MKPKFVQEMPLMPTLSSGAYLPSGPAVSWHAMASKTLGTTAVCKLEMHTCSQVGTCCSPCKFSQLAASPKWDSHIFLPPCFLALLWLLLSRGMDWLLLSPASPAQCVGNLCVLAEGVEAGISPCFLSCDALKYQLFVAH